MKQIDCSHMYLPFLCKALNLTPSATAQCIVCTDDGKPIAGVVYDGYNVSSVSAHIWLDAERVPTREWYAAIFDNPFNRLGVKKIIGQINSNNDEAIRLDKHFGFVEEARITDYSEDGDLVIYTMTKDQCRVLNSPLWARAFTKLRIA